MFHSLKISLIILSLFASILANENYSISSNLLNCYDHFILSNEIKTELLPDNTIFLTGATIINSNDSTYQVPYIGKFDIYGNIIWEKSLIDIINYSAQDIHYKEDGNFYVLINSLSNEPLKVIKFNEDKEKLWEKKILAESYNKGFEIFPQSNSQIQIFGKATLDLEKTLFKYTISSEGDSVTNEYFKVLSGTDRQYKIFESEILQIGDVQKSFSKHGIQLSQRDILFSKATSYDSVTQYNYGTSYSDFWPYLEYGYNIYPKKNGNYLILGCRGGYSSSRGLPFLLEVDNEGNEWFCDNMGLSNSSNTEYYSQAFKISDGLVLGAVSKISNSIDAKNEILVIQKRSSEDYTSLWKKQFSFTGDDYSYKIFETGNDSLLLVGYGLEEDRKISFISIVNEMATKIGTNVASNTNQNNLNYIIPNKRTLKILLNNKASAIVTITNLKGQKLFTKEIERSETINCNNIPGSCYIVNLKFKNENIKQKVMLK